MKKTLILSKAKMYEDDVTTEYSVTRKKLKRTFKDALIFEGKGFCVIVPFIQTKTGEEMPTDILLYTEKFLFDMRQSARESKYERVKRK